MKGSRQEHVVIELLLTEEEARWLQGVMQNPLHGDQQVEEEDDEYEYRCALWNTLNELLKR